MADTDAYGMTLREIQQEIGAWHARRWTATHRDPMYILTKLVEEVGEVAECLVKRGQDHPKAAAVAKGLPGELADVLIVLLALAHRERVDLQALVTPVAERRMAERLAALNGPTGGGDRG